MPKATAKKKSCNNGPMLSPQEMMARRREILRMGEKGLKGREMAEKTGMSMCAVARVYAEMKEIVEEEPDSLGLYLSPPAMKSLHAAFGIENMTLEELQEIAAKRYIVPNYGKADFRVRLLATPKCAENTVDEIEKFCIASGMGMKPIVKNRLTAPGVFTGMTLEAYAVIEEVLDGKNPNPKIVGVLTSTEKGRKRLFDAAPNQEIWDEIVAYCRRSTIYLGQFEEKSKGE